MSIGYEKQNFKAAQNEYNRLVNEDKDIASKQKFEAGYAEQTNLRREKQDNFENAMNDKADYEAQIQTLEDLKFETDDKGILQALDNEIKGLQGKVTAAEKIIDDAQVAFNEIAVKITEIVDKRAAEEEEARKKAIFLAAKQEYEDV
jgi:hypothetical protein